VWQPSYLSAEQECKSNVADEQDTIGERHARLDLIAGKQQERQGRQRRQQQRGGQQPPRHQQKGQPGVGQRRLQGRHGGQFARQVATHQVQPIYK